MYRNIVISFSLIVSTALNAQAIFLSEYAEGSSYHKYIEIFNGTGADLDLSTYSLSSCSNGCDETGVWDYPDNVTFEGVTIADGDVWVVCHGSSDEIILAECDQSFTYLSNGDDVFALTTIGGEVIIDAIGDTGDDPGSGWDVAGVTNATANHTLVRKPSVQSGNGGDWASSAGTNAGDSEWLVFDQNTWDNLGFHVMDPICNDNLVYMNMYDSWGDGWNDAIYTFTDAAGMDVATGTLTEGSLGTDEHCLVSGVYTLVVGGGDFDNEISWSITDADGVELTSGMAGVYSVGINVEVVYGCMDPEAENYDPDASADNGTCYYEGDSCSVALDAIEGTNQASGFNQWFTYTASWPGTMTISSQNDANDPENDTYLFVYTSCTVDADGDDVPDSWLANNDDCCGNYGSEVTVDIAMGDVFKIFWYGVYGPEPFTWTIEENDIPTTPHNLTADPVDGNVALAWEAIPGDDNMQRFLNQTTEHDSRVKLKPVEYLVNPAGKRAEEAPIYTQNQSSIRDNRDCPGEDETEISFSCDGGSWQGEVSWTVEDAAGQDVISGGAPFSGLACLVDGDYTVYGEDSFGDGWNGNYLTVSMPDGTNLLSFTVVGENGTATFTVQAGAVYGCMDPEAENYDPNATVDDGSCVYAGDNCGVPIVATDGTTYDATASTWYSFTNTEGGYLTLDAQLDYYTAVYSTCTDGSVGGLVGFDYYGGLTVLLTDPGTYFFWAYDYWGNLPQTFTVSFEAILEGCMDPQASNYDPNANVDDGSCTYEDCTTNEVVMNMFDSYGDGWNGNTYTITNAETGVLGAQGGLLSGDEGSDTLCLADGTYDIVVDGGSWQGEVSWSLVTMSGALIFGGGAPFEGDFTVPLTISFNIYRGETGNANHLYESDVIGTSYTDTNVDVDTEICYTVKQNLVDSDGNVTQSGSSEEACAIVESGSACSIALAAAVGVNSTASAPRWYSFTASLDGAAEISSDGSDVDTRVWVYSDCDGTLIGGDDDSGSNWASIFTWAITSGTTYYIWWDGYWDNASPFDWTLNEWNPYVIELTAEPLITAVGLEWTSIDLGWWDDGTDGAARWTSVSENQTTTHPVKIDKPEKYTFYNQGDYPDRSRQGGDTVDDATEITSLPYNNSGTTDGYMDDYDEACPYTGSTSPDVVYSYTAGDDMYIDISLCGDLTDYDTKLYVYENEVGNAIACNDDECPGFISELSQVALMGGNTYYIVVDGYGGGSGMYEIDVTEGATPGDPPANDVCENAQVIDGPFPETVPGTLVDATIDCEGFLNWIAVWYEIALPHNDNHVDITITASTGDITNAGIVVMNDCACDDYTVVSYDWPAVDGVFHLWFDMLGSENEGTILYPLMIQPGQDFSVEFNVTQNYEPSFNVYRDGATDPLFTDVSGNMLVDENLTEATEYCYTVSQIMPDLSEYGASNSACATTLSIPAGYDCDHAIAAAAGENNASGQPMWYSYTATLDGYMTISSQNATGNATWDTDLYVYSDCAFPNVPVAENDDCCGYYGPSTVTLEVGVGDEFVILWDDSWSNGAFTFTINEFLPASLYPPSSVTAEPGYQNVTLGWNYPMPPAMAMFDFPAEYGSPDGDFAPTLEPQNSTEKMHYYREQNQGSSSRDLTGSSVTVLSAVNNGDGTSDIVFSIVIESPDFSWADGCQLTFPDGVSPSAGSTSECGEAYVFGQNVVWGDVTDPESGSEFGCFDSEHLVSATVSTYDAEIDVGWYLSDDCYGDCNDVQGTVTAPVPTVVEDCVADMYEPNETPATATNIAASDTVGLTLCAGDFDWYNAALASHGSISITTTGDTTGSMGLFLWDISISEYPIMSVSGDTALDLFYTNLGDAGTTIYWLYQVVDYYNPFAQSPYTMEVVFTDPVEYIYNVYFSDGTVIDATNGYNYLVPDLVNGTAYGFYITSEDPTEHTESAASPIVWATPVADDISPPTNLQGVAGVASAMLMWDPPAPPGETINSAWVIDDPALPIQLTGSTVGFMDDYDEVCPYAGTGAPEVVYSYTPTADVTVDIDLCQSYYDTKAYVYENEYTPGAPYACDDDGNNNNGTNEYCNDVWTSVMLGVMMTGGNTYYIVVDGYGNSAGDYTVDITESTGRSRVSNNIEVDEDLVLMLKNQALEEWNETRDNTRDFVGYSVYRAIADGAYTSIATVAETNYADTGLTPDVEHHYKVSSVFTDGESVTTDPVTVVPVAPIDLPVPTDLAATQDQWNIILDWTPPDLSTWPDRHPTFGEEKDTNLPPYNPEDYNPDMTRQGGDTFEDAVAIDALPFYDEGTTVGYGADYGPYVNTDLACEWIGWFGSSGEGPDVVYSLTLTEDADLNISLCGSFYDTALGVFGSDYTQVLGNDDFCGLQSEVTCVLSAGTYYIVVSGYGASEGDYVINVWENEPPSPLIGYNMYRDGNMVNNEMISGDDTSWVEWVPTVGTYEYHVTAVYTVYGESEASEPATITLIEPPPNPPRNLTGDVMGNDVFLAWDAPIGGPGWLTLSNGQFGTSIGTGAAMDAVGAQQFSPQLLYDYDGMFLTKIEFIPAEATATYQPMIYAVEPGVLPDETHVVSVGEVTSGADLIMGEYNVLDVQAHEIDWEKELWVGVHILTEAGYPAGTDTGPMVPGGAKILWGGVWYDLTDLNAALDYNWALGGFVDYSAPGLGGSLSDFIAFTHPTEENTAFDHNLVLRHNGTVFPPLQNTDDTRDVLLHYKVLDYATVIADEVPFTQQELNLIDEEWGEHEYTVVAMYDEGASNPSNVVSVNLFNNPPSAVSLVAPPDNTTITITPDNVGTGVTMGIWTPAADPDNDPLLYTLYGNFDYFGQEAYWDSSTSATSLTITHAYWAAFMMTEGQEVDELTFAWSVQASDGTDTTHAGNGPRTLIVNVNAMYMDVDGDNIPDEFALYDNYPNPFNPVTSINYDIPEATDVTLDVYNLMGQRVRTLVSRHHEPGRYRVVWDATNDFGSPIASGMYIFKIQSKDFMSIKKMLLMK